ncbi:MAG: hypothetical protein HWD61_12765 [Parachlamydiaceae bacterium]|nr:MAG: hypothetical protein HWD61_12765 [Parachlamydiaceae bacterium]
MSYVKKMPFPFLLGTSSYRSILFYNRELLNEGASEHILLGFHLLCRLLEAYNREQPIQDIDFLKYNLLNLPLKFKSGIKIPPIWERLTDNQSNAIEDLLGKLSSENCLAPILPVLIQRFKSLQKVSSPRTPKQELLDHFFELAKIDQGKWFNRMISTIKMDIFYFLWLLCNFEKETPKLKTMIDKISQYDTHVFALYCMFLSRIFI